MSITKLLEKFSSEGREKAEHFISNWDHVFLGEREILLKEGDKKSDWTRIRICRYKHEYILVKGPMGDDTIKWLIANFGAYKTKKSKSMYRIPMANITIEDINSIIDRINKEPKHDEYYYG